jgi:S1-C subfamily serine protease
VLGDTPFAPSDHTSLYGAGAPVLFFYTGQHDDYHAPSDTADKINGVGIALVAKIALGVVERLQAAPRPAYVNLSPPRHAPRYSGAPGSAFLGIAVYGGDDSDGLRLASVMSGAAAERAGLHGGDVILRLDGHLIDSFAELRRVLAQKRPGDVVTLVYLRKGDDHATTITLDARP